MKQVFMCEYCGTMGDRDSICEHEKICNYKPENRSCQTCKHCRKESYALSFGNHTYHPITCTLDDQSYDESTPATNCPSWEPGEPIVIVAV